MKFNRFIGVDWSGAKRANGVAVAICTVASTPPECVPNPEGGKWRRCDVLKWLSKQITDHGPVLIGLDCAFAFPWEPGGSYFPKSEVVLSNAKVLWAHVEMVCDKDGDLYAGSFTRQYPFSDFFFTKKESSAPYRGKDRLRSTEKSDLCKASPECVFKLIGPKQVGRASLSGMRMLHHLKGSLGDRLKIWPFDTPEDGYSACVEIFPMHFIVRAGMPAKKIKTCEILEKALEYYGTEPARTLKDPLSDHVTDALVSAAALRHFAGKREVWYPTAMTEAVARREGWIFGVK